MIPVGTKVYFAFSPADLRKSFDGLSALAMAELERNPSEGGLFVFLNKRGNQLRILFRDRHGCCVLAKRLDRGKFRRPTMQEGRICWEIDAPRLMAFLEDIDLTRERSKSGRPSAHHLRIVRKTDT